jgi:hypothetical protein
MKPIAYSTRRAISALSTPRAPQAEGDVVADRQPGKARVLLEHHADAVGHLAGDRLALERRWSRRWGR